MWRVVVLAIAVAACSKATDATQAKRMPQPPPAPATTVDVPAGLAISVVVDGKAATTIDAARLRTTTADFEDKERRAWKLQTLLGADVVRPGAQVVAYGLTAAGLVMSQPSSPSEPQPALMLNRRGELVATLLAPNAPFPPFHGEGGRLHRPGDTTPHLSGINRVVITRTAK